MKNISKESRKKIRVAMLFGGKSAEHEVSLQSAKNVFGAIYRQIDRACHGAACSRTKIKNVL